MEISGNPMGVFAVVGNVSKLDLWIAGQGTPFRIVHFMRNGFEKRRNDNTWVGPFGSVNRISVARKRYLGTTLFGVFENGIRPKASSVLLF